MKSKKKLGCFWGNSFFNFLKWAIWKKSLGNPDVKVFKTMNSMYVEYNTNAYVRKKKLYFEIEKLIKTILFYFYTLPI